MVDINTGRYLISNGNLGWLMNRIWGYPEHEFAPLSVASTFQLLQYHCHKARQKSALCCAVLCLVTQSCLTLCNPMDSSPPGSSVHGILQGRILEWVAISFYRGSSKPRDWTCVSCLASRFFIIWATRDAEINDCYCLKPFNPQSFGVAYYIAMMTETYPTLRINFP